ENQDNTLGIADFLIADWSSRQSKNKSAISIHQSAFPNASLQHSGLPAAERGALSPRVPAAPHLRTALPRDGVRRARGGSNDWDGAPAPGVGSRLRGTAGDLRRRLRGPDYPRRADRRRPLQSGAARPREIPGPAGEPP